MDRLPTPERRRLTALAGHRGDHAGARSGLDDPEPSVRVAALRSLHRLDRLTTPDLDAGLEDPSPSVRIAAVELSAGRRSPEITHLLDDPDPAVVETTAWALGERANTTPETLDALMKVAADHDDPLARESAVAALGAIGDDRALPTILRATRDKPAVRRRAVIALSAFEGPEVDDAWQRARTDRDRQVREAVEELLGPE